MKYIRIILFVFTAQLMAQDTIMPLWPEHGIPNNIKTTFKEVHDRNGVLRISKITQPTIEVYLPSQSNATGQAVLIFPGGGYHILAYDFEGTDIAKYLNGKGIAGIVVKYRIPTNTMQTEKHNVPLMDAQRAMRLVRSNAANFNVEVNKIGILGFSAGGHLASTLGTHFDEKVYKEMDVIDKQSARPDFMALAYPVITMGEMTHKGSKIGLLGENPTAEMVAHFSNEKQVSANTPPTFMVHTMDDKAVPVENSMLFFKALRKHKVPVHMLVCPKGGHGFSLALKEPLLNKWPERFTEWINSLE